ncbi:MAG: hypothetical protein ACI8TX_003518 [Hyphomicrobiaceae bacterium]|jgi:hypothetical protein
MYTDSRVKFHAARLAFALLLLSGTIFPCVAFAGSIGFRVDTTIHAGSELQVGVKLSHTGDEAAADVFPVASVEGLQAKGEVLANFSPRTNHEWLLDLGKLNLSPGSYTVVVRINYADQNGYPFQVLSTAPLRRGVDMRTIVRGQLRIGTIPENGSAKALVTLEAPRGEQGRYRVNLVSPSGLSVNNESVEVDLKSGKKTSVEFQLTNRKLLVGTAVNCYALVTNLTDAPPQTDTIQGIARIVAPREMLTTTLIMQIAGMLTVLLIILELATLRRLR